MSPLRLPANSLRPSCKVRTVRVLSCRAAVPVARRVRCSGMLTSLLVHGLAAACAALIVVQGFGKPAALTQGNEGTSGDDWADSAVLPQIPHRHAHPVASLPAVMRDTPRRLLAAAPSALTMPEEIRPSLAMSPSLTPHQAERPVAEGPGNKTPASGKAKSHLASGGRGKGGKGSGMLSRGNGSGHAAPSSPRLLTQTAPDYPAAARRRGASGTAWVRVEINSGGSVTGCSLHRSCGHSDLDEAAVRTARRWRFSPATAGGLAVSAAAVVKVTFVLQR